MKTPRREVRCARCAVRLADPSWRLYSTHTKLHYCASISACDRRSARTKKLRKVTA